MTRYGMVIDTKRCFGCHTCEVACKVANNLPKELNYTKVYTLGGESMDCAAGTYPDDLQLEFGPFMCQHCDEPLCVEVCPTGASQKRDDGIVWVDGELCIGCESCMKACPYQETGDIGIRTHLSAEPEYYLDMAVGEIDAPAHKGGTVEKCMFCFNLIDRGEVPACMDLCPGRARCWGDLDDPDSDVSKALEGREYQRLNENAGTGPNVYYLV